MVSTTGKSGCRAEDDRAMGGRYLLSVLFSFPKSLGHSCLRRLLMFEFSAPALCSSDYGALILLWGPSSFPSMHTIGCAPSGSEAT